MMHSDIQPARRPPPSPAARLLLMREVCQMTQLRERTIYRLIRTGQFPKPAKITGLAKGRNGWIAAEVSAFCTARLKPGRAGDSRGIWR